MKDNFDVACPRCNSINYDMIDNCFELESLEVVITYDVQCIDCDNKFQIIDTFKYHSSEVNDDITYK